MDEKRQEEDRWRELHELLGVSGDERAAPAPKHEPPAAKAPPEPPPPVIAIPPRDEEEDRLRFEEAEPEVLPVSEPPAEGWEEEFDGEDTTLDESALPPEEPAGQKAPAPGDEEQPRRGRRRRRRGRRRGGDREEGDGREPRPQTEAPKKEGGERPEPGRERDQRGRRGRGGRREEEPRQARPPRAEEPRQARPPREEAPPADVDDLDAFEHEQPTPRPELAAADTDFSDWNVPSWQDLIASLYRPDR